MKRFPKQKRRLELMLKENLTPIERIELKELDEELKVFKAANPDFDPSVEFKVTLGDLLKAKRAN